MVGFLLSQTPPLEFIMTSAYYWDLYVLYVKNCERENYINDIDPHHYRMEWNHFWPRCVFGDWPVGQWLTLKQHAIASALQTLVFKENCMFSTHKSYLPPSLLELAWPYYCKASSVNGVKGGIKGAAVINAEKDENGKSMQAVKAGVACHAKKDANGRSLHALKFHSEKDENGKSVVSVKGGAACHKEKDKNGKSLHNLKLHSEKDENGKSIVAMKTSSQVWQSTVDGFTSNAGNVSKHNRANGWPREARVRLS